MKNTGRGLQAISYSQLILSPCSLPTSTGFVEMVKTGSSQQVTNSPILIRVIVIVLNGSPVGLWLPFHHELLSQMRRPVPILALPKTGQCSSQHSTMSIVIWSSQLTRATWTAKAELRDEWIRLIRSQSELVNPSTTLRSADPVRGSNYEKQAERIPMRLLRGKDRPKRMNICSGCRRGGRTVY